MEGCWSICRSNLACLVLECWVTVERVGWQHRQEQEWSQQSDKEDGDFQSVEHDEMGSRGMHW